MIIKNKDFIKLEFTGKIKDNAEIFDTNIEDDAKKAGLKIKDLKPFIMCVGAQMLPEGFEKDIENKETNKEYIVELKPENAFGKRNPNFVKMIPTKLFLEQKINPQRGMQLSLDGQLVKVLSNSGGRTLIDFNNPLAGKEIVYNYKILEKIENINEKVKGLQEFFFRKVFDFKVEGEKIVFEVEENIKKFIEMFSKKFEEILGKKIEIKVVEKKKEDKKENEK